MLTQGIQGTAQGDKPTQKIYNGCFGTGLQVVSKSLIGQSCVHANQIGCPQEVTGKCREETSDLMELPTKTATEEEPLLSTDSTLKDANWHVEQVRLQRFLFSLKKEA